MADLKASPDEAKEEHLPVSSDKALQSADHVLRAIYRIWPRRFEVYPMPNGEIAIDAPTGPGRSILVLCDSAGGALCAVNLDHTCRRARYADARLWPDGFLRDAIDSLVQRAKHGKPPCRSGCHGRWQGLAPRVGPQDAEEPD